MKIALVIPPVDLSLSFGGLKDFSNPQPSIGLAYIAAVLRQNGHDVIIIDAYVQYSILEDIIAEIHDFSADIVGISVLTPSADIAYRLSKDIRESAPQIKIVMGNMHASLYADEILAKGFADYIVHREGEYVMLELANTLASGQSVGLVKGISYLAPDGHVTHNPLQSHIANLDSLPLPAWDLFPLDKYNTDPRTEIKKGEVEMQILATRGCPNQCTFCSSRTERSLGRKYRMRDPEFIVDEMLFMNEKYGSQVFVFMDLAFPLVKKHAVALCEELIRRDVNKKFKWTSECRVKPLDEDLLPLMKKAGCERLCYGIESGNNDILNILRKNFTTDDVRRAVRLAHDAGLEVDGMFMIGLPGETEETIKQTIDFAVELNVRYAIFNIFVPYPGCDLFDTLSASDEINFTHWAEFTSYPSYAGGKPVYVPKGLSHETLMKLQKYAMKKFYLRPAFIFQELKRFKPSKMMEYINGFKAVMFK